MVCLTLKMESIWSASSCRPGSPALLSLLTTGCLPGAHQGRPNCQAGSLTVAGTSGSVSLAFPKEGRAFQDWKWHKTVLRGSPEHRLGPLQESL